jgi:FKBP-type peptidyl-prolyl cis-trans isomerase 2/thiol-disulfide isomerase/thioredoxin
MAAPPRRRIRTWLLAALTLSVALAGCVEPPAAEPRARAGDFAVVDLQAWDAEGQEVLNATAIHAVLATEVPLRLPVGWDRNAIQPLPPGVVHALAGARAGVTIETPRLPPEDAYGARSEERVIRAPRSDAVPREQRIAGDTPILESFPPQLRWANHTWTIGVLQQDADGTRVWLNSTPAIGTLLELPTYWNAHYHLWRSRVTGANSTHVFVEPLAPEGTTVDVGGVPHRVRIEANDVVADGNHPLAGQALRFRVALRELAFAGAPDRPLAPDAVLVTLEGARLNLSDLRGKPALVDFFATWCITCIQQAPTLGRAHVAYGDAVRILSVAIDPTDSQDRVAAFRDAAHADWTFAFDPTGEAARGLAVTTLPREVILDADGRVAGASAGLHPWAELQRDLDTVVAAANR